MSEGTELGNKPQKPMNSDMIGSFDRMSRYILPRSSGLVSDVCEGYSDVIITNMSPSFKDGLAFCAITHKHRPDLLDFHSLSKHNVCENMRLAFDIAERELGIPTLLDPDELVSVEEPDLLSIITYVSQLHNVFRGKSHVSQKIPVNNESSSTKTQEQKHTQFSSAVIKSSDKRVCSVCHTRVHLIQRVLVKGCLYHRSCFRCNRCRRTLMPISFTVDSETGSLQCSYPCKPAPEHDQLADQHSQNNTNEMDGDRSETDGDKMNDGCLFTSSETDIQEPPKPAPRKGVEPQEHPCPTPRSPDHRPNNVSSQSAIRKQHPWMKLVDPGPWYRLPPAPAPSAHSRRQPVTFNPFLDDDEDDSKDEEKNPFSCKTSVAHKPQTSSSVPSMHQAAASVHGFPLIKRKTHGVREAGGVRSRRSWRRSAGLERRGVQLENKMRRHTDEQDWSSDDRHQEQELMSPCCQSSSRGMTSSAAWIRIGRGRRREDAMLTTVIQGMVIVSLKKTEKLWRDRECWEKGVGKNPDSLPEETTGR
ncbi:hypothetical protein QQF64_025718 [Cirrhinus molitorella]|uniref:Uncharacterized protein n=1 Tax=Cirrhinus molitorella TaxID=172907 RepID=A0ABR3NPR6_9TELE